MQRRGQGFARFRWQGGEGRRVGQQREPPRSRSRGGSVRVKAHSLEAHSLETHSPLAHALETHSLEAHGGTHPPRRVLAVLDTSLA
jgi:hypothetical protein